MMDAGSSRFEVGEFECVSANASKDGAGNPSTHKVARQQSAGGGRLQKRQSIGMFVQHRMALEGVAVRLLAGLVRLERYGQIYFAVHSDHRLERQARRCPSLRGPT
jgi:hypothetical protein